MQSSPDDPERENPDTVAADIGVQGIEALPGRVDRYRKAKKGALDVSEYMAGLPRHAAVAAKVHECGNYLVFRHYFTIDKVRLHGASFCRKHLLCPLCAIRRGVKSLKAYHQRYMAIKASQPDLKPFLVTFTIANGPDLAERFKHLQECQRELWMQKHRGRVQSSLAGVVGAVWSYEIKRGSGSGLWHPHFHMLALAESMPDKAHLRRDWKSITGDSHNVDVKPIHEDEDGSNIGGFSEVFKYAVKFNDQPVSDTVHAFETLAGKRLLASAGLFRNVVVPDSLLDDLDGLDDLPYLTYFYRWLGAGYSLDRARK